MKSSSVLYVTAVSLCLLCTQAIAQEWVDVKDPKEVRALVSDKTFRGYWMDGRLFVSYVRQDGKALRIHEGQHYPRTWEISAEGKYCVTEAGNTDCYSVQRHARNYNEIGLMHDSGFANHFKLEDGVPQF